MRDETIYKHNAISVNSPLVVVSLNAGHHTTPLENHTFSFDSLVFVQMYEMYGFRGAGRQSVFVFQQSQDNCFPRLSSSCKATRLLAGAQDCWRSKGLVV